MCIFLQFFQVTPLLKFSFSKVTKEVIIANKTDIMLTNIQQDAYLIGYVSMVSINDDIKAPQIDSVVVIVNKENVIDNLTSEEVRNICKGETIT